MCENLYPSAINARHNWFTKYFRGGLTQGPTSLIFVVTHSTFGTTSWVMKIGQAFNVVELDFVKDTHWATRLIKATIQSNSPNCF